MAVTNATRAPYATNTPSALGPSNYLLDRIPGALIAYSPHERMRRGYAGPLFEALNGSGARVDIGPDAMGRYDSDALAQHCGASPGFMSALYDQIGDFDLTELGFTDSAPQVWDGAAAEVSGSSLAPLFDGVDDYLSTSIGLEDDAYGTLPIGKEAPACTMAWIFEREATGSVAAVPVHFGGDGDQGFGLGRYAFYFQLTSGGGTIVFDQLGADQVFTLGALDTTRAAYVMVRRGDSACSTTELWRNGTKLSATLGIHPTAVPEFSPKGGFTIGARMFGFGNYSNIRLSHAIVWLRQLDTDERALLDAWMVSRV